MQSFQAYGEQPGPSLKRRSRSPSPGPSAAKRRPPASYAPSIYSALPASYARSLSADLANSSGTPSSERSSPGLDWLKQTQELHIETPPVGELGGGIWGHTLIASGGGEDVGMVVGEGQDHSMSDDPHPAPVPESSYVPPPAAPFHQHSSSAQHAALYSAASFAFADPTFMPAVPSSGLHHPRAPHDAPPLHQHLAGSPQSQFDPHTGAPISAGMTPSSSTGSLHSSYFQQQQPQPHPHPHPHELHPMPGQDVGMSPAKGGGGWKVTMGYRPDCEKCQQHVPGHYSHVVAA